jgi:Ras-related protein Rab-1A
MEEDNEEDYLNLIEKLEEYNNQHKYLFRICLLGDTGVGKTSVLTRFCDNSFIENYNSTLGVDFRIVTLKYKDIISKLNIWDTAGQERFKSLAMTYYRKAYGILLLFDVTKRSSFLACKNYLEEVRINSDKKCVIYLVGNKIDLVNNREISTKEAENFAKKENIKYIETSAVKNMKVTEAFTSLLNNIYQVKQKDDKNRLFLNNTANIELKKNKNFLDNNAIFCCNY